MRKFWKIFLRSLGTYLGLEGGLSFKRFKVKGCQCAFLMHMGTRITTEAVVSLGTEILFTLLQVSVTQLDYFPTPQFAYFLCKSFYCQNITAILHSTVSLHNNL